jgi:hypothetical protein
MTERDAAIHAATSLLLQVLKALRFIDFLPIFDPHIYRASLR